MKPEDLKQWRREHGYSQQALADLLGVRKVTIYRWERQDKEGDKSHRDIPPFLHLTLECIAKKKGGKGTKRKSGLPDNKEDNNINQKEVK